MTLYEDGPKKTEAPVSPLSFSEVGEGSEFSCPTSFRYLNTRIRLIGNDHLGDADFYGVELILESREKKQIGEIFFVGIERREAVAQILELLAVPPNCDEPQDVMSPRILKEISTILLEAGAALKSDIGADPDGLASEYATMISNGTGTTIKVQSVLASGASIKWINVDLELPDVAPRKDDVLDTLSKECGSEVSALLDLSDFRVKPAFFYDLRLLGDDPTGKRLIVGDKLVIFVAEDTVLSVHSGANPGWQRMLDKIAELSNIDSGLTTPQTLVAQIFSQVTRMNERQVNLLSESLEKLSEQILSLRNPNVEAISKHLASLSRPSLYTARKMKELNSAFNRFLVDFPLNAENSDRFSREISAPIGAIEEKAKEAVKLQVEIREQIENLINTRSGMTQKSTNVLAAVTLPAIIAIGLLDAYGATWSAAEHVATWIGAGMFTLGVLWYGRNKGWM